MVTVTVQAIVDEARQLHIALPDEMPLGPVEVLITTLLVAPPPIPGAELTRGQARALMAAAGVLSTVRYAPPDARPLSEEEREEFGRLAPGSPDTLHIIDAGRGPR